MDNHRFDALTKMLATGTSRRCVLKGLAVGLGTGLLDRRATAQDETGIKVGICHRTESASNPYRYIEVDVASLPDHAAHGDLVTCPNGQAPDQNCDCLTSTCLPVSPLAQDCYIDGTTINEACCEGSICSDLGVIDQLQVIGCCIPSIAQIAGFGIENVPACLATNECCNGQREGYNQEIACVEGRCCHPAGTTCSNNQDCCSGQCVDHGIDLLCA